RREQDADMPLVFPMWPKHSGEYDRPDQGLERRHMWAAVVCHGEAEWMPSHGVDEFSVQRTATGLAQAPGRFSESANCVAEFVRRRVRWQRLAEGHGQWIGNALGPFCEKPTPLKAEDAAPHTIQVCGNDRHLPSLHDPFEAAAERQQRAGAGDLSFGEDADDLSVVECLPRVA